MKRIIKAVRREKTKRQAADEKESVFGAACCELCLRHVPGHFGRADKAKSTERAAAIRDQTVNS